MKRALPWATATLLAAALPDSIGARNTGELDPGSWAKLSTAVSPYARDVPLPQNRLELLIRRLACGGREQKVGGENHAGRGGGSRGVEGVFGEVTDALSLRGGWMGIDLVREIVKAQISQGGQGGDDAASRGRAGGAGGAGVAGSGGGSDGGGGGARGVSGSEGGRDRSGNGVRAAARVDDEDRSSNEGRLGKVGMGGDAKDGAVGSSWSSSNPPTPPSLREWIREAYGFSASQPGSADGGGNPEDLEVLRGEFRAGVRENEAARAPSSASVPRDDGEPEEVGGGMEKWTWGGAGGGVDTRGVGGTTGGGWEVEGGDPRDGVVEGRGDGDGVGVGISVDVEAAEEEAGKIEAARAARAAKEAAMDARERDEIAFLRELEARGQQAHSMGGATGGMGSYPTLGQHMKSVATTDVPYRLVDEVGAQIATALAVAVFKGMTHVIMACRNFKRPEKVTFGDVVGCDEAKEEIQQVVDFLVNPSAYDKLGAKRPKGILLVGPPGTGKTLIAKACAGEAGVPFLYACGSDFNGIYVGMGVAAVKRLFAKARRHRKSIIYIDELDYIGRARNSGSRDASGATQDREATLNQLLSEMDGFEGKDGIVVMASTNRKDILDEALLRSGRFDMQVDVERPDRLGREQLFSKYIKPLRVTDVGDSRNATDSQLSGADEGGSNGDRGRRTQKSSKGSLTETEREAELKAQGLREDIAKELAELTPYMTGADVANVCATAGRIAARVGSDVVTQEHFSAAVDRVSHGLEKPGKMVSKDEQQRTAVHEAGHAIAGWMLSWCDPVVKVSIIWRGNALGFSQTAIAERLMDMRETVLDNVCMTLAGRAAEEVVYGNVSGGASSDLRQASRQLYQAVTEVGFGSTTGLLSAGDRRLSERVIAEVDQEVQDILAQQYERALELIRRHRDKIDMLSSALIEHGVVHKAELEEMLGPKVSVQPAIPADADPMESATPGLAPEPEMGSAPSLARGELENASIEAKGLSTAMEKRGGAMVDRGERLGDGREPLRCRDDGCELQERRLGVVGGAGGSGGGGDEGDGHEQGEDEDGDGEGDSWQAVMMRVCRRYPGARDVGSGRGWTPAASWLIRDW